MKDVATLHSEIEYLTRELAKAKTDMRYLRLFVATLLSPEDYGHAVSQEVREKARFVLKETSWVGL